MVSTKHSPFILNHSRNRNPNPNHTKPNSYPNLYHNLNPTLLAILGLLSVDGATSLRNAWNAGKKDLSVYMNSCVSSSTYVTKNGIKCRSPADQVDH